MGIIDEGLTNGDFLYFIAMLFLYLLCLLLSKFFSYLYSKVSLSVSQRINLSVLNQIIAIRLDTCLKDLDESEISNLDITLKTELNLITNYIVTTPIEFVIQIISMIVAFFTLLYFNFMFSIIVIVIQFLTIFLRKYFNSMMEKYSLRNRIKKLHADIVLNEVLQNIKEITFNQARKYILKKINTAFQEKNKEEIKYIQFFQFINLILTYISELSTGIFLGLGGYLVIAKKITLGFLMSALQYAGKLENSLSALLTIKTNYSRDKAQLNNIMQLLYQNEHAIITNYPDKDIQNIRFENVSFAYHDKIIFESLDCRFDKNHVYYLIGESGIGKTTLVKLLLGEYEVMSGDIWFNQTHIKECSKRNLSSLIMFAPNNPIIYYDTVCNNIILDQKFDKERFQQVCNDCLLNRDVLIKNRDENTILHEHGDNMSAGQKQRIAIARALYANKPILIFDEPTANLDTKTAQIVLKNIGEYKSNRLIIIVTHLHSIMNQACDTYTLDTTGIYYKKIKD